MSKRWSNAPWRMWSRPVDHYHVYFHGLLYRATITWHTRQEEEVIGWYEPGWPKTRIRQVWYKAKRYELVVGRNAYRRNPEHQKKVLTPEEEQRRQWKRRESDKRFARKCPCRRSGPGRWVKKQTTSYNRAWVKYCLRHDRDEDIHPKYGKYKFGYWD